MRFMERIRRRGQFWLVLTGAIFAISIFFGLGSYFFAGFGRGPQNQSAAEVGGNLAAKVNGQGVTEDEFTKQFFESQRIYEQYSGGKMDPVSQARLMSTLLDTLVEQKAIDQWAKSKGIEPTSKEIQDEIANRVKQSTATAAAPPESGNVFGELAGKLTASSAANKALQDYLVRQSMTEEQLRAQVREALIQQKAQDEMLKEGKEKNKQEMKDTKVAEVEKALAGGMSFEDAAKKYSADKKSGALGGEIRGYVKPGFFDKAFDKAVFEDHPAAGTVTKPFETEFGWQIVKIIEWPKAEGPDFEKAKPGVIKQLKDKHPGDPNYDPTPQEIADEYSRSQVRIKHITLQADQSAGASKIRSDLSTNAKVVIYDPLVLGYRALKGLPDKGPKVAKESGTAKPQTGSQSGANARPAVATAPASAGNKAAQAPPADKGTTAGAAANPPAQAKPQGQPPKKKRPPKIDFDPFTQQITIGGDPRYQEAVDYFTQVSKGQTWKNLAYYLIARTYFDWSHDEYSKDDLPLKPAEVQAKIKDALDQTLKLDEYNPYTYILQAGFLKDQGKKDDAAKALGLAIKYASGTQDVLIQAQNLAKDLGATDIASQAAAKIAQIQEQRKKQQEAQQKAMEEQRKAAEAQKKAQEQAQQKQKDADLQKQLQEQAPPPPPITKK